ncbi:hypothetical protein N431DRAFT_505713 [Stipitochalara longipes BDJ]|nr:hypothetical protein N431DRAFT_505713 [Stipitochalara longipes BDJ]
MMTDSYVLPAFRKSHELITLYAGNSAQKFIVHKEFACFYSPVLKAASNSEFVEGQTQTYRLHDTTERAVCLLSDWIYTQTLDITQFANHSGLKDNPDRQAVISQDKSLVELWVLAKKLLIPSLQNLVVTELYDLRKKTRSTATLCIKYVYENTCEGSPLRLLMVDMCASQLAPSEFTRIRQALPDEMLIHLVTLLTSAILLSSRRVL